MTMIYLTIAKGASVGVDRDEALTADQAWFEKLYRNTVYRAKRKEARAWARRQIEERDHVLAAGGLDTGQTELAP